MSNSERSWLYSDRELLTPEQAATLLGVTRETLYRWVDTGKLPALSTPDILFANPTNVIDLQLAADATVVFSTDARFSSDGTVARLISPLVEASTFRMLEPTEIARGMVMILNAFGEPYIIHGARRKASPATVVNRTVPLTDRYRPR